MPKTHERRYSITPRWRHSASSSLGPSPPTKPNLRAARDGLGLSFGLSLGLSLGCGLRCRPFRAWGAGRRTHSRLQHRAGWRGAPRHCAAPRVGATRHVTCEACELCEVGGVRRTCT